MAAASAVKGFLFVLALFISSLLGAVVLMGPTTLLLFISRRAYRAWNQVYHSTAPKDACIRHHYFQKFGHVVLCGSVQCSHLEQVVAKMWFQLACFLIETMFGVQFVFYGESVI